MTGRLEGTVALITGASSGIGAATARRLANEGADIAIVARRRDRLEDLANELKEFGGRTLVIEADVTVQEQAKDAVQRTVDELGRLDVLVNNAGVMLLGPIVDAPTEEWDRMIALNVLGLMYTTHAALPHLLSAADNGPRQVADLINISSVAGRVARSGSGVYNASKWGVNAFSESLRQEVTSRHVRVGVVEPGFVDTELISHNRPEIQENLQQSNSEMEPLDADDIADAIGYIVTRPRHAAVNELLIRPTTQSR
jgi:NADP-dependent 3-hydroxy acid dehydrogenase YdfG